MASERQGSSHVGAQRVLPFNQCLIWYLENNAVLRQDDRALLQRWLDDDRASEVWSAILAHSERHSGPIGVDAPIHFIIFVLVTKNAAKRESAIDKVTAGTAELKQLRVKFDRRAKKLSFEKKLEVWAKAAKELGVSPLVMARPAGQPRVRSDRNGSRARTYFIREVSGFIHDVTDRWLDQQVAVLTEIAFNTPDIISEDTVRKARSE